MPTPTGFPDEFARKLIDGLKQGLPSSVRQPLSQANQEVESWVRDAVGGALNKLDLVTREEFEVQTAVLQRTRARLEEVEQRLSELESKLDIEN